MKACVAYDLGE